MIVVLDSNAFHGDVRADRSRLRGILDGAVAKGAFELFVPEVVLRELDKQFTRRSKRVVREVNEALRAHDDELRELGIDGPQQMQHDDADRAGYRAALEARLLGAGAKILPVPADLAPALDWSIHRRKPFNDQGNGFPDAVTWLSLLDLAASREEEIVFVTSDKDFRDRSDSPRLADELREDLAERGLPEDRIRLVIDIDAFADEIGEQRERALSRAEKMAADRDFDASIERALVYAELDEERLALGIPLDEEPTVASWDLRSLVIGEAVELPGGQLILEGNAEVELLLNMMIFKADYYLVEGDEEVDVSVADPDFSEHYLEAEAEVILDIELEIATDGESEPETEITGFRLAPIEVVHRALRGRHLETLLDAVRSDLIGQGVEGFTPEEDIEGDIDEVAVSSVHRGGTARLREILDTDDDYRCHLELQVEADVEWVVNAPTPFDVDRFGSLVVDPEADAPAMQGSTIALPLLIDLTATWDPECGWDQIEFDFVRPKGEGGDE